MRQAYYDGESGEESKECCYTKPYAFFHQVVTQNIYHYYISGYIEDPTQYTEMINRIHTAMESDTIYMHLNTVGGDMSTGIQLMNAMTSTPAHVIASIEGEVSSMGTMIFLSAKEFMVHENSLLMFHNYTGGVWGKGHEQVAALESATKWTEEFMHRIYIPFMTSEEVDRLIKGEDIYMHPPEIIYRLNTMLKIRQLELEAEQEQVEVELQKELTKKVAKKKTTKKKVTKKKASPRKK
jgi:ATP-dependent Clp protease protease subunit